MNDDACMIDHDLQRGRIDRVSDPMLHVYFMQRPDRVLSCVRAVVLQVAIEVSSALYAAVWKSLQNEVITTLDALDHVRRFLGPSHHQSRGTWMAALDVVRPYAAMANGKNSCEVVVR